MEGCVSVVGFRELVGKSLKLVKDESVDEESFGPVIRQVRSEARAVLLKLVAELVSNGEVTKKSQFNMLY